MIETMAGGENRHSLGESDRGSKGDTLGLSSYLLKINDIAPCSRWHSL